MFRVFLLVGGGPFVFRAAMQMVADSPRRRAHAHDQETAVRTRVASTVGYVVDVLQTAILKNISMIRQPRLIRDPL